MYLSYAYQQFPFVARSVKLAGGIGFSGSVSLKYAISPSGGLAFSGAPTLVKNADNVGTLTGGIAFSGNITEIIVGLGSGQLEGFLNLQGTVTVGISAYAISIDGGIDFNGVLNFQTNKTFSGGLAFSGALTITALRVSVSGGLGLSGALLTGAPVLGSTGVSATEQDHRFRAILVTVLS